MNTELRCSDGTVVPISEETEQELRKAFAPKYVWGHGDVFKTKNGSVMVHLILANGPVVYTLEYSDPGIGTVASCLSGATPLFNINKQVRANYTR